MSVSAPLPLFLIGTLAVELDTDLGLSASQVGVAASLFYLGSGLLSMAAGAVVHRVGWLLGVRLAATASLVAFLSIALLARTPYVFIGLFLIACVAHALNGPAGNTAIAEELPPARLGFFFGLKQCANPTAGMLAGAAVPFVAAFSGWRTTFLAGAALPAVTLVIARGHRGQPVAAVARARRLTPADGGAVPVPRTDRAVAARRWETTLVLALGGSFATASVAALAAFVVLSAVDAGISPASAGVYVVLASLAGLLTRLVSGWWVDRTGTSPLRLIAALLAVGAAAHLALAAGSAAMVLPATLLAYAAGWGWPGLFMYAIALHFGPDTARATGRMQAGMMLGGVAGPTLFAALQHRFGYSAGWLSVAALCGFAALLVLAASSRLAAA
jgi:MFS family permease